MKQFLFIILLSFPFLLSAQDDTTQILTFEAFMEIVRENHPLAKQANIQTARGDAELMKAKGGFDPKIGNTIGQKYFEGSQYYSLINAGLKIPTWFGIDVKAGLEQNQGTYLNSENKTPKDGLWYAGISLPVGQGLFIDKRRADLAKAKIYQRSTEAERQFLFNELLYDAGKAYWDFFQAYNQVTVFQNAVEIAEQRQVAVKRGANLGDKPAIDTLEAGIQVQSRKLSLQQAELAFANSSAMLSVYLWAEGVVPLELAQGTVPFNSDNIDPLSVDPNLAIQFSSITNNHPSLRLYQYKVDKLVVDRRLKKEQLKPTVNVKYNPIARRTTSENPLINYSINNYTWGLEFGMPIFLRKERGAVKLAEIKIQETRWEMASKRENIINKARVAFNEWNTTRDQIDLYSQTVLDYGALLQGERQKFDIGESSLFLVNSREKSYINAQVKIIELLAKNRKAALKARYTLGIL